MKIRIIDLLVLITNKADFIPEKIRYGGMVWTYEPDFGQYKNNKFQELIKYMHGDYNEYHAGLIYPAIYRTDVEIVEDIYED